MMRARTNRAAILIVGTIGITLAGIGSIVAVSAGTQDGREHAGASFEYLAHVIMPNVDKTSADALAREFGGASGIDYLPGSLVRTDSGATARFVVVSDDRRGPRVFELEASFTQTDGTWAMRCELRREIKLPHPFGDAESIVVLERTDERTWYAVSYEAPPGVAIFTDPTTTPPREQDLRRDGSRKPAKRLDFPDEIRREYRGNRGFESLAVRTNDDGSRELWSVMEAALKTDGPEATSDAGSRVRACVHRIESYDEIPLDRELFYTTDALPKSLVPIARVNSLSEIVAMPDGSLATLERSATAIGGYDGALYRVRETPDGILAKSKLMTIKDIAGNKLPWIGNYEGVCVGPNMADLTGNEHEPGHLLLFIADDNFGSDHQRGTQVLAVRISDHP